MGFISVRVSDLTGIELDDDQVVNVVVRHPEHEEARQFDASQEEKVQMTVIVLNRADGVQGEVVRDACLIPYELGS